jgi:hypothetical protein
VSVTCPKLLNSSARLRKRDKLILSWQEALVDFIKILKKVSLSQELMDHACNLSNSGGRDQED